MTANQNLTRQAVDMAKTRIKAIAANMATQIGQPIDAESPARSEQARLWNLQNPQADPMQVQQLVDNGQHAQAVDMLYPWRNKLIGPGTPTTRADRADALARIAGAAAPPAALPPTPPMQEGV